MSVTSQLNDLAANTAAIRAAIEARNPAVPTGNGLASFPAAIKSIQGGREAWTKPAAWPDIREILAADTHQYANKLIALLDADASMPSIDLVGGTYYVLSDGYEGGATTHVWDTSKDIVGADGRRYHWGIVMSDSALYAIAPCAGTLYRTKVLWSYGPDADVEYANNNYPNLNMNVCESVTVGNVSQTGGNRIFSNMYSMKSLTAKSITLGNMQQAFDGDMSLVAIDVGTFDTTNCTNFMSAFNNCAALVEAPLFDSSHATSLRTAFNNCASLRRIPSLDASSCTDMGSIFNGCNSLEALPDDFVPPDACAKARIYQNCYNLRKPVSRLVADSDAVVLFYNAVSLDSMGDYVDLRAVTNFNSMFLANSFVKVPTTLLVSTSLNISTTFYRAEYKDRFAEFDGNGNLVGGLVYNINEVSGLTLTVGSTMRGFFSSSEVSTIESAMTAKGWTLSW